LADELNAVQIGTIHSTHRLLFVLPTQT
jgi:hypothetical protein